MGGTANYTANAVQINGTNFPLHLPTPNLGSSVNPLGTVYANQLTTDAVASSADSSSGIDLFGYGQVFKANGTTRFFAGNPNITYSNLEPSLNGSVSLGRDGRAFTGVFTGLVTNPDGALTLGDATNGVTIPGVTTIGAATFTPNGSDLTINTPRYINIDTGASGYLRLPAKIQNNTGNVEWRMTNRNLTFSGSGNIIVPSTVNLTADTFKAAGTAQTTLGNATGGVTIPGDVEINGTLVELKSATDDAEFFLNSASNKNGKIRFKKASSNRWEIGTQADDDLRFYSYGAAKNVIEVDYATGDATFSGDLSTKSRLTLQTPAGSLLDAWVESDNNSRLNLYGYYGIKLASGETSCKLNSINKPIQFLVTADASHLTLNTDGSADFVGGATFGGSVALVDGIGLHGQTAPLQRAAKTDLVAGTATTADIVDRINDILALERAVGLRAA